jgi:hypothetical protein
MTTVTATINLGSLNMNLNGQFGAIAAQIEEFIKSEFAPGAFDIDVTCTGMDESDDLVVDTDDEWAAQYLADSIRVAIGLFPWYELQPSA